jgi:hypothetical protein
LQIAFDLKGNGQNWVTGASGEADLDPGIDAIYRGAGLEPTSAGGGGLASVAYTPASQPEYLTIKLFTGDATDGMAYVYQDCLVDTLTFPQEGGESTVVTASITIGSILDPVAVALPVFSYGNQATLSPPICQQAAFTYSDLAADTRCFQTWETAIANTVEEFSCSNATNGKRLDQSERTISCAGSVMVDQASTLFEWEQLVQLDPTALAAATWSYGADAPTTTPEVFNRVAFDCTALQMDSFSYDRAGSKTTAEVETHCVDNAATPTGGDEFTLTFE